MQNPDAGGLAGRWTCRSLLDDPDLGTGFDALEFGRGTIEVLDAPMGAFRGRIFGPGWELKPQGSIGYGTPRTVRFQGIGVVGGEQWVCDPTGAVVPPWPNGVEQRPAVAGSVVRTLPHSGGRTGMVNPAGIVASSDALRADS